MEKFLQRIINQGTNADYLDHQNRRIIYANIIYVSLPIVYLIFVLIDYESFFVPVQTLVWDQFIFAFEIVVCLLGVLLNRVGFSMLGRCIFLFTWPLLLHIIPVWHQHSPSDYFLAFPIGIIFHAVLIQLMLSIRHERLFFWPFMIANFLLLVKVPDMLLRFSDDSTASLTEFVSDRYYLLDAVLYWLLFSIVVYFLVRAVDKLFEQEAKDQLLIEDQKEELAAMNEELLQSNESLYKLNEKISAWNENLEATVANRTREVEEQNSKLREYAFFNAHKLRGPFCRIQGLMTLLDLLVDPTEKANAKTLLNISVSELESVIAEIQQIVKETNEQRD